MRKCQYCQFHILLHVRAVSKSPTTISPYSSPIRCVTLPQVEIINSLLLQSYVVNLPISGRSCVSQHQAAFQDFYINDHRAGFLSKQDAEAAHAQPF